MIRDENIQAWLMSVIGYTMVFDPFKQTRMMEKCLCDKFLGKIKKSGKNTHGSLCILSYAGLAVDP